jgi:tRNA pseudouridine13 synthase
LRFDVPALDKELGLEVYLTETEGIGGRLRERAEDFVVEEIPLGDSSIEEFTSHSLSRVPSKYEKYAISLLEKRGIDTIHAVSVIAQRLHLDEEEIGYCGLKDAKAISRQLVSIPFRRPMQREYEFPEGIRLQLLGFRYRPLSIGELAGNQFSITVRRIDLESEELVERLDSVTSELHEIGGFPGYFGYQRFGSHRPISHLIGKMFYQNNLEGAVTLLLTRTSQSESEETREARKQLAVEVDYGNAADYFPDHLGFEKKLLVYLEQYPKDFEGAIKKLPARLRKLFYDAYQSYLFNKALSLRLRTRKTLTHVKEGDLVASFDDRGYVKKLTEASDATLTRIENELADQKVIPVLSIPNQLGQQSNHPTSPEVFLVVKSEGFSQQKPSSTGGRKSSPGIVRPIVTQAQGFGWIVGEDEFNLGFRKVVFYFRLRRGFYSTMLLREFLKPGNPIDAGF